MVTKRKTRSDSSKASETTSQPISVKPPVKKARDRCNTVEDGTIWVDDDTMSSDDEVQHVDEDSSSDYFPADEEEETDEEFIQYVLEKYVSKSGPAKSKDQPRQSNSLDKKKCAMKLSKVEQEYFNKQPLIKQNELVEIMNRISDISLTDGTIPHKFRILNLPISDYVKSNVLRKISVLGELSADSSGEGHKLRNWVDAFMRIPFGKTLPLPVQLSDGNAKCTEFMVNARLRMDKHIYGMEPAKLQIMQIIAKWIVNPTSVGNVIALQGPMGVGKTSFAKNAIAEVLQRPFEFFTLGGASDIANFIGHSYTYEGSLWGRIVDSLMHAGTMNPVMYFDELDKISTSPQGEEIVSMLIHMTDRSQNNQFHDRYFSGVDLDLSQCLFVFSCNDIDRVHPILRDRMTVINCAGYSDKDKSIILKDYIWPHVLEQLKFTTQDIVLPQASINFLIQEYSDSEKGVRTLIRVVESMMTRVNMLRVTNHPSMKDYKFHMDVAFPLTLTEDVIRKLMCDSETKEPETWRSLYT
jgi:ATP-dependent Lon protease